MSLPPEPAYIVQVDRAAAKLLRKLDRPVQARIVYTVRDQELIVLVVHLGHRSDVYDTL